jgi:ureidoacrylate peracid hydrolase
MAHLISFVRPLPPALRLAVEAQPHSIELDLARTALVVVDMQNDFAHPEGWFGARGVATEPASELVPKINALTSVLRPKGVPVIWLNWGVRSDLAEMPEAILARGGQNTGAPTYGDPSPSGHGRILVEGEWGARVIDDLVIAPTDINVSKARLSGFAHNALDAILRKRDITTLLFAGVNTDRCVFATLQDAGFLGYDCVLLSDATATSSDQTTTGVIHDLVIRLHGAVATSADFVSALTTPSNLEVAL